MVLCKYWGWRLSKRARTLSSIVRPLCKLLILLSDCSHSGTRKKQTFPSSHGLLAINKSLVSHSLLFQENLLRFSFFFGKSFACCLCFFFAPLFLFLDESTSFALLHCFLLFKAIKKFLSIQSRVYKMFLAFYFSKSSSFNFLFFLFCLLVAKRSFLLLHFSLSSVKHRLM